MVRKPSSSRLTDEQQMMVDLAQLALERIAPHEMPIFDDEVAHYLTNPSKRFGRPRERPLGGGLDFSLLAPYALAVAGWSASFVLKVAEDELADRMRARLARVARSRGTEPEPVTTGALDAEQVETLRATLLQRLTDQGLAGARANELVDAVIDVLRDRPEQ
jgi:hypothetical protein